MAHVSETTQEILCCAKCGKPSPLGDKRRLPRGWKRQGETVRCKACQHDQYVLRAVTLPIVAPIDMTWAEFRAAMREAWGETTRATNWLMRKMYDADHEREAGQKKLHAMPKTYLYPEARQQFPALPSQVVATLEQRAKAIYRATRYEMLWTGERSMPNARYPAPLPVPTQAYRLALSDDGILSVSLPLAGHRVSLKLAGGYRFARPRKQLERLLAGEGQLGEMAIYRVRAGGGDHRNGEVSRDANGERTLWRYMAKFAAWIPRTLSTERAGTLFVRTDSDSLLVALDAKDERLWVVNADRLRQWSVKHARWQQRAADDRKAETRTPASQRRLRNRQQRGGAEKHRARVNSFVQETAAHLVAFAQRRKLARIEYNDDVKTFVRNFPWEQLRSRIAQKCEEVGIEFASGEMRGETPSSLAGEKKEE